MDQLALLSFHVPAVLMPMPKVSALSLIGEEHSKLNDF